MNKPKCIVLLSGGMDSSTLLALAQQQFDVIALTLIYGQRHQVEVEFAKAVAAHFKVPHKVMDVSNISELLQGSSLTSPEIAVPQGHYEDESMKATVVPGRNTILLSLALGYCISQNGQIVAYAAHAGDHVVYPDCRPEFILAMAGVFNKAHYYPVALWVPFQNMDKGDILVAGIPLGVPYECTWTCYDPQPIMDGKGVKGSPYVKYAACGRCGACQERLLGFAKIGQEDPIDYVTREILEA
jgi:7-cyano-7-deazaguanine synthase